MSLYVLDTDILTLLQAGHAAVLQNVSAQPPRNVAITVLSVEEQVSGWYAKVRQAKQDAELARAYYRLANSVQSLSTLPILHFDLLSIDRYNSLRQLKINVRKMDLRIAASFLRTTPSS